MITYTLHIPLLFLRKAYFLMIAFFMAYTMGISQNTPCTSTVLSLNCGPKVIGSNVGMTNSGVTSPPCGNYQGGDSWYRATVPPTGVVEVQLVSMTGSITDLGMAMYTAPNCTGPFSLVECNNATMPYIIEGNLPVGNEIYIRIWENGNNQFGNYEIEIIDPNDVFCLNEDAQTFNFPADTCMQTTANVQNEKGCAWYRNTIDFSQDFDEWMILFLGDNNGGADGMTITFQNDPSGTNACGSDGEGLGALGIQNAAIIEVDTYNNGSSLEGGGDYNFDHIALWTSVGGPQSPLITPIRAKVNGNNVEDNTTHLLRVLWSSSLQTMAIFFDSEFRASINYDFVGNVFGSKNVFWGSTGSTGFFANQQYLCPFIPNFSLPVELAQFNARCEREEHLITWTTLSETNNSHFELERSKSGESFERIAQVNGHGTSSDIHNYEWKDEEWGDFYYRLKQVDFDGKYEYSPIVYSACQSDNVLIYPNPAREILHIQCNEKEPVLAEVYDLLGNLMKRFQWKTGPSQLDVSDLNRGHYTLKLQTSKGIYIKKFVKQ